MTIQKKQSGIMAFFMFVFNFFFFDVSHVRLENQLEKNWGMLSVMGLGRSEQRSGMCMCMVLCVEFGWGPALRTIM